MLFVSLSSAKMIPYVFAATVVIAVSVRAEPPTIEVNANDDLVLAVSDVRPSPLTFAHHHRHSL